MRSGGDERDECFLCFTLLVIVGTEVLTLTDALPFPHTHTHIHQQELMNYVSVRSKPTNQYKMSGVAIDQKCGRCLMSARKRARRIEERAASYRWLSVLQTRECLLLRVGSTYPVGFYLGK